MMLMMYERVVVSVCAAVFLLAVLVNLCPSHSNCSVVTDTRQKVFCGDDEYCKLQAFFLPVLYQRTLVELNCANKCIENNLTQPYPITYTKCCKKTQCPWINLKDKTLLDGQQPTESSSLSPTTTLLTHTTHIVSSSTVTTFTPLDQNKSKFTEVMTKIPVWVDIFLIVVVTCMTLGLVVFIIGFWQYNLNWAKARKLELHLNWVKARKLELHKAKNRRRFRPKIIR